MWLLKWTTQIHIHVCPYNFLEEIMQKHFNSRKTQKRFCNFSLLKGILCLCGAWRSLKMNATWKYCCKRQINPKSFYVVKSECKKKRKKIVHLQFYYKRSKLLVSTCKHLFSIILRSTNCHKIFPISTDSIKPNSVFA